MSVFAEESLLLNAPSRVYRKDAAMSQQCLQIAFFFFCSTHVQFGGFIFHETEIDTCRTAAWISPPALLFLIAV